ncbi:DegV family protein [Aquibacillus koreensis]|uniref:DegV family protein n=1 Tax=Aquibacillus koreensis TaxID=279446 RepID=A0A9X4AJL7_9BACI|nr:DegV family protein [Aquibacillus koreensis]MCT2534950.1 DegV family protein [Aquibacillus koreensis]MDC3422156.1 DegV family protein [Aquibacillus koreensis]
MNIQLMTDSGSDLSEELLKAFQVNVVPLYIHFGDEEYQSGITIDTATFNEKLKHGSVFPLSSAPGPNEFYEAYKKIDPEKPIIVISLSKGISSTYNHAVMGMNLLLEEEPNRRIAVINSTSASPGQLLLLHEAHQKINEGYSFDELVPHLQERAEQTTTLFILKTIDNLVRGGRLDRVRGAVVKSLNIKLLMRASDEGKVEVSEKVRGDKKALRRFVEQIGEYTSNFEEKVLVMTHCNAQERAQHVLNKIKESYPFKKSIVTEMGPAISTHAGEGGLVIAFFKDK